MPRSVSKETEIKWIDPWSVGKIYGCMMAVIGFFIGLIIGIIVAAGAAVARTAFPGMAGAGVGLGIVIIILAPFLYGLLGMVIGILCSILYNWAAPRFGGVKFKS